ncbi:uncharacterized protein [Spinacia oleracea]|uniref:Uncharacterized protein isoform X3 n=1 Tax=Spinacia oleracea TaxID=3562 RepID=A0ABM3R284_SPIOL|nr:uncharacterized protein LOC130464277 isoform X3 [Spinacia oleracea]
MAMEPKCGHNLCLDDDDLGVEYMMCPWDTFRLVYNDYARRVACSPQHLLICRQGGEVVPPLLTAGEIGLMEGETLIVLGPVPGMNVNSFVRTFSVVATMDYPPVYMVQRRVTDYLCSVITEYANWLRIPPLRVTIRHNMIVREGTETIQDVGIVNGSTLYAIIE